MILYQSDWDLFPAAIPDFKTENVSFIRYSGLLKTMGVENHLWPLALLNPELQGINPHNPDLTETEKIMILEEVGQNPMYFFREVARVPAKGATSPEFFRANRGNMALYFLFFSGIASYLIQIRQTGKSLSTDMLFRGLLNFWAVNTNMVIITKDSTLRIENTDRLKDIESSLPPYLKMVTKKDSNNTEGITVNAMGNALKIILAQKSKLAALNLGRGLTNSIMGIDEFAFIYNNDISVPAALSAGTASRDTARRNGQPFGTMFYTTAGYLDTPAGEYAYSFYKNAVRWNEKMVDQPSKEALQKIVSKNARGAIDLVLIEMNHQQLGYTNKWLSEKIREAAAEGVRVEAEFLNKWSKGSSSSILSPRQIKVLTDHIRGENSVEISPQGFIVRWFVPDPNEYLNRSIAIGIDMSEAIGKDDISLHFRDPITGETLGTSKINNANLTEFGEFVYYILKKYTRSVLVIERKSMAMAILDQLALMFQGDNINIFRRVFNWVVDDYDTKHKQFEEINTSSHAHTYNKFRPQFGYLTTGSGRNSRDNLYGSALFEAVDLTGNRIRDKDLVNQLTRLEMKNGRIDHTSQESDDMVIAFMLTWWFLKNAKNLEFYGINSQLVLSSLTLEQSVKDEQLKQDQLRKQEAILEEIDSLLSSLQVGGDKIKSMKTHIRINLLKSQLDDQSLRSLNIEARLRELTAKPKHARQQERLISGLY